MQQQQQGCDGLHARQLQPRQSADRQRSVALTGCTAVARWLAVCGACHLRARWLWGVSLGRCVHERVWLEERGQCMSKEWMYVCCYAAVCMATVCSMEVLHWTVGVGVGVCILIYIYSCASSPYCVSPGRACAAACCSVRVQ
jgi:hypothetical protein